MSRAALSAKVFAVYVFVISTVLVIAPNVLLTTFGLAPTTEVWIRVVGILAFNIGIYVWVAAKHEDRPFFEASVYTRLLVFLAFIIFAMMGLADPTIVLFGVIDLSGAMWTYFALRSDAQSVRLAGGSRGTTFTIHSPPAG